MNRHARRAEASKEGSKRRLPLVDRLETRGKKLVATLMERGPTAEKVIEVAAATAALTDQLIKEVPPPQTLACGAGCAWCCHNKVDATVPEVLHLMQYLEETLSEEHFTRVKRRIIETDDKTRGLTSTQRMTPELPCPLLEENRCIAYKARPVLCRGANAVDSEGCRQALLDQPTLQELAKEGAAVPIVTFETHLHIGLGLCVGQQRGLTRMGLMGQCVELNHGLRIAIETGETAMQQWLDGKPIFDAAIHRSADP